MIPLSLLIVHFIADFLLQSDWMALNKSKNREALAAHCFVYALCFVPLWGLTFAFYTFVFHYWTDRYTSKCTSKLWFIDLYPGDGLAPGELLATVNMTKRHWFFVAIGFDQLIHFTTLALTYRFILGG